MSPALNRKLLPNKSQEEQNKSIDSPFLSRNYIDTGVLVDGIFELVVMIIMIGSVIAAYFQTSKLDINHHPIRFVCESYGQ